MRQNSLLKYIFLTILLAHINPLFSQTAMQNVFGRECFSLNGYWSAIPDIRDLGLSPGKTWWKIKKPSDAKELNIFSYDGGLRLKVPGDWNSQAPQFDYYEAPMWYKLSFNYKKDSDKRNFLHFGAVCMHAMVYLNGEYLGKHMGGYTPFQFEITDKLNDGENYVIVRVDNIRDKNSIPGPRFGWWNYGGITRDVNIISTPKTYIKDYWVRLDKNELDKVEVDIKLDGSDISDKDVMLEIPAAKISKKLKTDDSGKAKLSFKVKKLKLWSPANPFLYDVKLSTSQDAINDKIGFRSFRVQGNKILLNNKPVFLKGVNIHEEIASEKRRAVDKKDADFLIDKAVELGCNFIRLTHYPHSEYMVRRCDERGIMLWEENPLWQDINFSEKSVCDLATLMMKEMMDRDRNRCSIIIWSVQNETWPAAKGRNDYLINLIKLCKQLDNTRAITSAMDHVIYENGDKTRLVLSDPIAAYLDIISINKYMGWYTKWEASPKDTQWEIDKNKPVIISEFGAEGVYGIHDKDDSINSYSEEYMAKVYNDDLTSFNNIPNLCGCVPWLLFDHRLQSVSNTKYQDGWNRKGLLSPDSHKKKTWFIMKNYFQNR